MSKFAIVPLLAALFMAVGCSSGPKDEAPVAGEAPKPIQADPNMPSPEERARGGNESGGPGEGS